MVGLDQICNAKYRLAGFYYEERFYAKPLQNRKSSTDLKKKSYTRSSFVCSNMKPSRFAVPDAAKKKNKLPTPPRKGSFSSPRPVLFVSPTSSSHSSSASFSFFVRFQFAKDFVLAKNS